MRALLAIDQGLLSPGVAALRRSLMAAGLDVAMLGADIRDESAAGQRPESILAVGNDPANPVFKLDGSPIDSVHVALGSGLVGEIDLVITGLGVGARADGSDPVLAAAHEAALMGRLSLAISAGSGADLSWCGVVAGELAAWLVASPPPVRCVLGVDVPSQLAGRGLVLASAGDGAGGRDHIALTPLALDAGNGPGGDFADERLAGWVEDTIESINPRLGAVGGGCDAGCCG